MQVETADCEKDTKGAIEWLRLSRFHNQGEALDDKRQTIYFPKSHQVIDGKRKDKYGGTMKTPEEEAVLETTLPADSTDKRVVRRRAALAAALAYEYERMNWLARISINYRVDDGVPVPDDGWKR